jgi:hypothetical protein
MEVGEVLAETGADDGGVFPADRDSLSKRNRFSVKVMLEIIIKEASCEIVRFVAVWVGVSTWHWISLVLVELYTIVAFWLFSTAFSLAKSASIYIMSLDLDKWTRELYNLPHAGPDGPSSSSIGVDRVVTDI